MRPDEDYVADILDSAHYLVEQTAERKMDALGDRAYRNNILHELQTIGEACRALSDEFKLARPDIPWRDIITMRNFLVHAYHSLDTAAIWHAATIDVPELVRLLTGPPTEETPPAP